MPAELPVPERTSAAKLAAAGVMRLSDVDRLAIAEWHRMVDVNVEGLPNTTCRRVWPKDSAGTELA